MDRNKQPKPYQFSTMHLAYSALRTEPSAPKNSPNEKEILLRYRAYLNACDKHRDYLTEIQKYLPGWMPKFR